MVDGHRLNMVGLCGRKAEAIQMTRDRRELVGGGGQALRRRGCWPLPGEADDTTPSVQPTTSDNREQYHTGTTGDSIHCCSETYKVQDRYNSATLFPSPCDTAIKVMSEVLRTLPDRRSSQPSGDRVTEPEPAHLRDDGDTVQTVPDDEREAIDLQTPADRKQRRVSWVLSPERQRQHWYNPVRKLWRHNIRMSVPHVDCRDHLGMFL